MPAWFRESTKFQLLLTRIDACGVDSKRQCAVLAACIEQGWGFSQVENALKQAGNPLRYAGDTLAARLLTKLAYDEAAEDYGHHQEKPQVPDAPSGRVIAEERDDLSGLPSKRW